MLRRILGQVLVGALVVCCLLALVALVSPASAGPNETALERIIEAQERHTERLLAIKGVVGTAAGAEAVIVLVKNSEVAAKIPKNLDGVAVEVKVSGKIVALEDPTARFDRPVPIGVSTGNVGECSAGTIACRVTDGSNVYALSNNHVYALENRARRGSKILQPGLFDTDCNYDSNDVVGTLRAFKRIKFSFVATNKIDAAIALCTTDTLDKATPSDGYGTPQSETVAAEIGQQVMKYGRTTGQTSGPITGVNVTVLVEYSSGVARFVDQILIETAGAFSLGGDSGSLIVTDPGLNPVGLLFAGNEPGTMTVANPIDLVLQEFGVTIDGVVGEVTDVAVTEVNAPSSAVKGDVVAVKVTVKNVGNQDVTTAINVTLTEAPDGATFSPQTISGGLVAGASQTLTFSWDTTGASLGDHTLTATHDLSDDNAANNSMSATVTVSEEGVQEVNVTGISPDKMQAGTTISVTITGSGFVAGATVTFEDGKGLTPTASDVVVVDANTITATITAETDGPRRDRWSLRVTNPDSSSDVLKKCFAVIH